MATSLLKSFIEVVNPAVGQAGKKACDSQGRKIERGVAQAAPQVDPTSKSVLEVWSGQIKQPGDDVGQGAMRVQAEESENVLEVSGEKTPSLELADQIAVRRWVPVTEPSSMSVDTSSTAMSMSMQQPQHEAEESGSEHGDIVQDAQFFQDLALQYQSAYQSLEDQYNQQAILVKEASEALKASESHVSAMQEELMTLKHSPEADIQRAVGNVVSQYEHQLSSAQSRTCDHQSAITQLQEQVQALQVSLASQWDLPSVGTFQREVDLREEVFNFVPGTVNTNRGAVVYHSPDQPFQFQKQVQIRDRPHQPDLESDTVAGLGPQTSHNPPCASTPFRGLGQVPLNCTFDVSGIPVSNTSNAQDAATITAEVLAAAAAQASKEFWHMREPKITKLWGGYLADVELNFLSWWADVLANIQDRDLDNKAAIQLIKEQTLDNACHEVEFQLYLCGSEISYQDLLRHLSVAFQGGDDEANLLAEFYSHGQKVKESEEAFADELQILTCKVIIKKPDFHINLDSTLKQRYASQHFDHNSVSIAKTLLVQMQQCSFMEFHNELAWVLGTRQHAISKASTKTVSTKSVEVESGEEDAQPSKSQIKKDKKISAQSSQIKDLQNKLDQAVAENSQIQELLSPATLTTAFTNALMTSKTSFTNKSHYSNLQQPGQGKPFLGKCRQSKLTAGKDGVTNPEQSCRYCKDTGHLLENCLWLQAREQFLANQDKAKEELN